MATALAPPAGRPRLRALAAREAPALIAAALAGAWLLADLHTPDLAAQVYRAHLFDRDGLAVWDNHWYGGHHVPGYSLIFPPLGALIGIRILGALSALASAALFARLARGHFGQRARAGILWFSLATVGDLMIGRLTFALGVTVGLAALLALQRGRSALAGGLAVLCSATSPVAGLFLSLAGVTLVIARLLGDDRHRTRAAQGLAVALPALAMVGIMAYAFPEGGRQPYSQSAFLGALLYTAPLLVLLPRSERTLRLGVVVYLLAVVAAKMLDTPMGGNASRLGAEFAGPVLLCAVWGRVAAPARLGRHARTLGTAGVALAGAALAVFQLNSPVREAAKGVDDPSLSAAYYRPVIDFLSAHPQTVGRVEVPFTLTHWDATFLGERFSIARGWERQLDTRRDGLFYAAHLTPSSYSAWLTRQGVAYVALPDARLDPSSRKEAALIRRGLPYLTPVFSSAHWRIFAFTNTRGLVQGPAALIALGDHDFTLVASGPGAVRVLVHFTPYWKVVRGSGCVARASGPGDWTQVIAAGPGPVRVSTRFSLGRIFNHGPRCTSAVRA